MTTTDPAEAPAVRVRLDLAYDGSEFAGWAAQPGLRTVQGVLEDALTTVLRLPAPARLTVAGRTDAGVHARGQVAHVDVPAAAWAAVPGRSDRGPGEALVARLAGVLGRGGSPRGASDVVVRRAVEAPVGFDARFAAVWRRYAYRIADDVARRDPLRRHDVLWHNRPLDVAAMDAAAQQLLGEHDFAAYCKPREGATTIRTLLDLRWRRLPGGAPDAGLVVAEVRADAFCHSMVRALVGASLAVGEGRRPVGWPARVLAAGVRDAAVTVAPAHGLTLEEVAYPADHELAARARQARARRVLPENGARPRVLP
ncbi:tRNA pseudouridine(38-40) synthase TruA [Georgenia thermotolerans]|uniref:tRNA pseudouridine(38-40) synthase TruA n=1 Tax=Georgenia thermotolerans TaxID=527326 RepID=UPI001B8C27DC|nr:tRNA pseudouridine(38-40) synthase TruA [Georgenia thermotolerans]